MIALKFFFALSIVLYGQTKFNFYMENTWRKSLKSECLKRVLEGETNLLINKIKKILLIQYSIYF